MCLFNFKKKEMKLLIKKQKELYENAKICYICKENCEYEYVKDKQYRKVRHHCHNTGEYRGAAHSICNLKYSVTKKLYKAFHNGFNYDYNFVTNVLAEDFKIFTCLGQNTEKYITFTVKIDKNGQEIITNIYHILQFIYSIKFTASSLSNLVNNLSEGIYKIKFK